MQPFNLETLQTYAAANRWELILPELCLGVLALALLILDLLLPAHKRRLVGQAALLGQGAILVMTLAFSRVGGDLTESVVFNGLLQQTFMSEVMRVFFLIAGMIVTHLGMIHTAQRNQPTTEYVHLVTVATAGLMLLAQAHHFVLLFMALETVTVSFYVLVAYQRRRVASLEAGLKYLVLGALSSGLLLFGIMLLYAAGGSPGLPMSSGDPMEFGALGAFITANPDLFIVRAGALLVLAGVLFKIGTVPFQIWIPDVYQGAPTPVTAFLAVASKAGGVVVLLNLVLGPFSDLAPMLVPLLSAVAVVTILFGNLAALSQRKVKRLLGLSGVAHAGYLLIGVIAAITIGREAALGVIFYLSVYLLASFAVMYVVTLIAPDNDADADLGDYAELLRERPFLGTVLTIGLGSLAGIPPLAGFIGKLVVFYYAFVAELYVLLGVAAIGVVISIYYYFGWILAAAGGTWRLPVADAGASPARVWPEVSLGARLTMGILTALTLLLGFHQGLLSFLL